MAQSVKINGATYEKVPSVTIPLSTGSGNATFYDTSDASADKASVLSGKTYYGSGGKLTGNMPNNGAVDGTISTLTGKVEIPKGYTTGGSVSIVSTEASKLVSSNIKSGVTILGVKGSSSVLDTSDATASATMIVSGKTAYVGGFKITGSLTLPTISQDSTTMVLSIS